MPLVCRSLPGQSSKFNKCPKSLGVGLGPANGRPDAALKRIDDVRGAGERDARKRASRAETLTNLLFKLPMSHCNCRIESAAIKRTRVSPG